MTTRVHQALHGYSDGHRQFACSTELTPKDARIVLVMSDASGPGVTSEGEPYFTGYPLQESGLYAFAKTWPAPEMPRPGCVWTHTLFIEFADLAVLDCPSLLAEMFRRPLVHSPGGYTASLQVQAVDSALTPVLGVHGAWFGKLASALYEHPCEQVWARRSADPSYIGDAVLRLWDQQWPRLRRSFKFCTLTTRDRSQDGLPFDLQLCPGGDSSTRLRFADKSEGYEATTVSNEPWLVELTGYALRPTATSFREALRLLGTDVLGGREAMRAICSLQAALTGEDSSSLSHAVELVQTTPPLSSSRVAQEMVVRGALSRPTSLGSEVLAFVIDHLDLLNEAELGEHAGELIAQLWATKPAKLVELLSDERLTVRNAMRIAAQDIEVGTLVRGIASDQHWLQPLLSVRPDLAEAAEFWEQTQICASSIRDAGIDLHREAVLQAAVMGLRDDGAIQSAVEVFGAAAILECVQRLTSGRQGVTQLHAWIRHACYHLSDVASFLAHTKAPSTQVVQGIARELPPDAVPNDFGADPWLTALDGMRNAGQKLPIELHAYGFRRALGWRSKSIGPLLQRTFDALHQAASEGTLPDLSRQLLRELLPWVKPSEAWDIGLQLRRAVAKRCVDVPVAADELATLTNSDALFGMLLDEIWEQWGGSRYLRKSEEAMVGVSDIQVQSRRRLIEGYIDKNSSWWT